MNHKKYQGGLIMKKISIFMTIVVASWSATAMASGYYGNKGCYGLPSHSELSYAIDEVVDAGGNGGLGNEMWLSVVNRDGVVCGVARSGGKGEQWPGSRVISAQKANTANAFSLPNAGQNGVAIALSTANLWAAVQPGGSLFGLQHSNPVDTKVAYRGNGHIWGTPKDPLVGKKVGGVNVFGGGLAIYSGDGKILGAIGVSGDTSCTDHIVAWRVRQNLGLDNAPGGVGDPDDNMILDLDANGVSASGFGHPQCFDLAPGDDHVTIINDILN